MTEDVSSASICCTAAARAYSPKRLWLPFVFTSDAPSTTKTYTLSLHDALPIFDGPRGPAGVAQPGAVWLAKATGNPVRSEEHTSELQSPYDLVCRLLLEKKNK